MRSLSVQKVLDSPPSYFTLICGAGLALCAGLRHNPLKCAWVAASQLDLPSLTPLDVADCGRLQLGVWQLQYHPMGYFSSISESS